MGDKFDDPLHWTWSTKLEVPKIAALDNMNHFSEVDHQICSPSLKLNEELGSKFF